MRSTKNSVVQVIDILKTTIGDSKSKLKVVSYDQAYLENSIALFAKFNSSESCYQSESDQFTDMTLLSGTNVVISGQWSSFTQSIPITMMLGHKDPKENKRFCEVGLNGDQIRCTRDYGEWLKRWNTPNETESTIERFGNIVYDNFKYANHQQWPLAAKYRTGGTTGSMPPARGQLDRGQCHRPWACDHGLQSHGKRGSLSFSRKHSSAQGCG